MTSYCVLLLVLVVVHEEFNLVACDSTVLVELANQ